MAKEDLVSPEQRLHHESVRSPMKLQEMNSLPPHSAKSLLCPSSSMLISKRYAFSAAAIPKIIIFLLFFKIKKLSFVYATYNSAIVNFLVFFLLWFSCQPRFLQAAMRAANPGAAVNIFPWPIFVFVTQISSLGSFDQCMSLSTHIESACQLLDTFQPCSYHSRSCLANSTAFFWFLISAGGSHDEIVCCRCLACPTKYWSSDGAYCGRRRPQWIQKCCE